MIQTIFQQKQKTKTVYCQHILNKAATSYALVPSVMSNMQMHILPEIFSEYFRMTMRKCLFKVCGKPPTPNPARVNTFLFPLSSKGLAAGIVKQEVTIPRCDILINVILKVIQL